MCRLLSLLTYPLWEKKFDAKEGKPCWVNNLQCLEVFRILGEGFPPGGLSRWTVVRFLTGRSPLSVCMCMCMSPIVRTSVSPDVAVYFFLGHVGIVRVVG